MLNRRDNAHPGKLGRVLVEDLLCVWGEDELGHLVELAEREYLLQGSGNVPTFNVTAEPPGAPPHDIRCAHACQEVGQLL